jgi:hypothetical protein
MLDNQLNEVVCFEFLHVNMVMQDSPKVSPVISVDMSFHQIVGKVVD